MKKIIISLVIALGIGALLTSCGGNMNGGMQGGMNGNMQGGRGGRFSQQAPDRQVMPAQPQAQAMPGV